MATIEKAAVSTGNRLLVLDVVPYLGRLWLVPAWREFPDQGAQAPERLICLDDLRHRENPKGPIRYSVDELVPMSVIDGTAQESERDRFEVIEAPPIAIPLQSRLQ